MNNARLCPCGSGELSWWECDARGIELCRACPACRAGKLKGYRPEVLSNPNYTCDEPIDGD